MSGTVWDQEFFRRRAAGERAAGQAQEPAAAIPLAPAHATIAELLLARARDDNTALLFEDRRWSWRELATHKVSKPTLRRMLWHGGDPVYERTGERYALMTADRKSALEAEYARHGRDHLLRL